MFGSQSRKNMFDCDRGTTISSRDAWPDSTAYRPPLVCTPNMWAMERRRRSHSIKTTFLPACAKDWARFTAMVVLPSSGTDEVSRTDWMGESTLAN